MLNKRRRGILAFIIFLMILPAIVFAGGAQESEGGNTKDDALTIVWMPKVVGMDYFNSTREGAEQAGEELGINIIEDSSVNGDVTSQIAIIDNYITKGCDILAVSCNDPNAIAPILKKAKDAGITVITWDADADPNVSGRPVFINQASFEGIGRGVVQLIAKYKGDDVNFGILTTYMTAPNQVEWAKWVRKEVEENYPGFNEVDFREGEEDQTKAFQVAQDMIKAHPDMDAIIGLSASVFPGAAEAASQMEVTDKVFVTGLGTPNSMKRLVHNDEITAFLLWNTEDLGYLTVYAAKALHEGKITGKEGETFDAGRLGSYEIGKDGEVVLGPPYEFNKSNIDNWNF